ncbi:MAG TPA: DUF4340 domain-containing protein [Saprospiraceae bacterium]|nr:DUF4340 domain-containing protein [Saprospiraceae bacterium]
MTTRTLAFIFSACLLLFGLSMLFRGHKKGSFDPEISSVDSAKVDRIKFISGGAQAEEFELKKTGDSWEAIQGSRKITAPARNVDAVINTLSALNAQRLLTNDPAKYAEYEIGDDQASRVMVWQGSKQVADLWIGGFKFDQAARTASSYVRVNKKPEVFLVDGFVSMSLKQRFSQYRDKKLVKANADDLNKLEWSYGAGQIKSLEKDGSIWHFAGMEAVDTSAIKSYLTGLANAQGSEFSELSSTSGLTVVEQLTLYGNNMTGPTVISAYANQDPAKPFLINSSANPEGVFISDSMGIYKHIFGDLRQFWPDGK